EAGAGLWEGVLQRPSTRMVLREIAPPVDEPVAVGADAAQVARVVAGGDAFRHLAGRALGRTAGDAINSARPARLLRIPPALVQEPRQLPAEDQHRPPVVDGGQPSLEPVADGVLVQFEQP